MQVSDPTAQEIASSAMLQVETTRCATASAIASLIVVCDCSNLSVGHHRVQKFLARAEELLKDDPQAMKAVERLNAAAEKVSTVRCAQSLTSRDGSRYTNVCKPCSACR